MTQQAPTGRSIWGKLYHGETNIRFVPRWKLWFALSAAVIIAGVVGLVTNGLNLGIDFEGGVAWEAPAGDASVTDVREAVEEAGLQEPTVQELGSAEGRIIRVQAEEVGDAERAAVSEAIAEASGADADAISFNEVGPSWGDEITEKARNALLVFLVAVTLYITLRFELRMALATLLALLHDILVTVGVYALLGLPVTPATVIAFLTILGFSIYDGVVVFDRVDENAKELSKSGHTTYSDMVNTSMNEVLMRSLNTSITALLPIASLLIVGSLILGATSLQEFALALFVGLLSGAYSSIFIASPALALLKEREPKWRQLRERLQSGTGGRGGVPAMAGAPASAAAESFAVQARGRKKGKTR